MSHVAASTLTHSNYANYHKQSHAIPTETDT